MKITCKKYKKINLKIINISNDKNNYYNELYLFLDKKGKFNNIIKLLNKNGIKVFFKNYFVIKKFKFENTGKIKIKKFINI